jgi:two-component system response regulator HydG
MGETVKVLVEDDDRQMVKTVCDILKIKGFATAFAFSGKDAVGMVREEKPDCVLMDIKMPGIDGVQTLRMMQELVPGLPIVLMSACASSVQAEEAKRQGAYSVLSKPIDIEQVLSFFSLLRREKSILVVDDDPQFTRKLKMVLQAKNYHVATEDDPKKVLAHMEQQYKLAVVLDLKLGDTDGLEILRDIRHHYPTKPVVLVAGYREDIVSNMEQGIQIGAYSFLFKPLATEGLIELIEEIRGKKLRSFLGEPFQA